MDMPWYLKSPHFQSQMDATLHHNHWLTWSGKRCSDKCHGDEKDASRANVSHAQFCLNCGRNKTSSNSECNQKIQIVIF